MLRRGYALALACLMANGAIAFNGEFHEKRMNFCKRFSQVEEGVRMNLHHSTVMSFALKLAIILAPSFAMRLSIVCSFIFFIVKALVWHGFSQELSQFGY